ncbi:MAG: hypothetical protein KG028_11490 [Actinobacteria bacterium]|nr:hypothetical protein [Actinomycetota bacterium]
MTAPDPDTTPHGPEVVAAPIVDWRRTAQRLRRQLLVIAGLVVVAWLVLGLTGPGLTLRLLAEVAGFGVFLAFLAEVVVVGGSAVRGLLRAGERGERLARADVTLLPPQLRRRGGGCP